jgi:hypothetical protein
VTSGGDSLGWSLAIVAAVNSIILFRTKVGGSAKPPENEIVTIDPYVLTPGPFEGRITTR